MKKFFALLIALCLVICTFTACSSDKSEETAPAESESTIEVDGVADVVGSLTMGTGGEYGTYYAFGGVLSTIIDQASQIDISVVPTGGSKDNIISLDCGIYQLGMVQSDVMTYAYEGTNSFEDEAIKSFRVIGALYAETVQIVTVDDGLTSVSDLKGKSVCVGDVGSGTYFNTVDILNAYGMTINDITPVYQSFEDSTESLKNGDIDAAFICAGSPTTAVTELAESASANLISIDEEHMAKLLEAYPYYAEYTISGGTYEGAENDTKTVAVKCTLICSADLDEDLVYAITKIIFEAKDSVTELHAKGAELDLEFATSDITVPFHEGAAKFYKGKGIEVKTA